MLHPEVPLRQDKAHVAIFARTISVVDADGELEREVIVRTILSLSFTLVISLIGSAAVAPEVTAQTQTVSAKGSATVSGASCELVAGMSPVCSSGGSGAKISFSFQGTAIDPNSPTTVATGNFTAFYPDTGLKVQFVAGTAVIFPNAHAVSFSGTCQTTDAAGAIIGFGTGTCSGTAQDNTSNGADDTVFLSVSTTSGFIQALGQTASGNINID